ncbi:TPA: rhamnan synthesis F family protein [Streptococcus suis]
MSRLLVYVHYNKYNDYSEYVDYQLREITPLFDRTVFVSNSQLSTSRIESLKQKFNISNPIIRENIGFDFAAWRDGIFSLDSEELFEYDSITFMNDTCFGPIWNLESYYQGFEQQKRVDFWGMTNHAEVPSSEPPIPEHLQSYFMVFKKSVFTSEIFLNFMKNVENFTDVQYVINQYETQLTKLLVDVGFNYQSLLDTTQIENKGKLNFSLDHPKELLEKRIPLLKVKLFELHQPIASSILEEIKKQSNYPTDLIIDHLTQIYYPDSIFKLSQKLLKKDTKLAHFKGFSNGALVLHLTDFWAFNLIIDYIAFFANTFDIIISVDSVELKKSIYQVLEKSKIEAQIFVIEKCSFSFQPLFELKDKLINYSYVGFLNSFMVDSDDFYSGRAIFSELAVMMFEEISSILFEFLNHKNIGVVIPDVPTLFRMQRLVDADMENRLAEELNRVWEEVSERKNIDFSTFDSFVLPYGGAVWLKHEVLAHLLTVPISQLIRDEYYSKNYLFSIIDRLVIYLAWDIGYDFRIIENSNFLPSFLDNKVLNRQKVYQEVEVIKEIEIIKEVEVEVIKEVEIPIYPDFYINMSELGNSEMRNLFIVPFKALKFIIKWNFLKWRRNKKEKK